MTGIIEESSKEHGLINLEDEEFIEAALLDTLEDCVNCVDGVQSQHEYEDKTISAAAHGLTEDQTLLLRSKLIEEQKNLNNDRIESYHFNTVVDLCGLEDLPTVISHCMSCDLDSNDECQNNKKLNPVVPVATNPSQHLKDLISSSTSKKQTQQCAICLNANSSDDKDPNSNTNGASIPENNTKFVHLPCCGSHGRGESSSIKICTVCILLLTLPNSDGSGRIGRCPQCRSWITVKSNTISKKSSNKKSSVVPVTDTDNAITISKVNLSGECKICCQEKEHLVDDGTICDACFIGRTNPLLYECEKCHKTQKIPYPLYRYQSYMDQYGEKCWRCHSGECNPQFTKWRILPDQINLISPGDEPLEWDVDYIENAKERVLEAKNEFSIVLFNGESKKKKFLSDFCFIC